MSLLAPRYHAWIVDAMLTIRLVAKVNLTHTVGDLRNYVSA